MVLVKWSSITALDRSETPHSCSRAQKSSAVSTTRECLRVHDFFPRLSRWNEDFVDFTFGCYVKWRANTRDIRFTVSLLWFDIISPNCYSHMSVLHFVEQSPDPWPTKKQKKGKKEKKSDRKTSAICIRSISAISSFPPLRAEENRKIHFTAVGSSGKAAVSSFPPLRAEEK